MDYKELVYLGLSEKEAKVYLASLQLGQASAQKIAEKAGVNRATTYVQIESLSKKGLMSTYHKDKKQYYCAESPEKLNILFREQEAEIKKREEYLKSIMSELKSVSVVDKDRPTVRYFEGKNGLSAMAEELFIGEGVENAKMIYSYDLLKEIFSGDDIDKMRKRRKTKKINVNSIVNDRNDELESDATRFLVPENEYRITSDIALYGNKVRIATQKNPLVGMIIENKEISETLKIIFDLAWKYLESSKKYKKKN